MKFILKCPNCGASVISKKVFFKFVRFEKKEKVEEKISEQNILEAVIEFDDQCPRCCPTGKSSGKVKLIKMKKTN